MNGIILRVFALGLMVTLGHALQCYKCDIGILGICATSKETCKAGELCFSGVGKAASVMDIKMKGCLLVAQCNKTTQTTGLGNTTIYSMTKTCCATDLSESLTCNQCSAGLLGVCLNSNTVTCSTNTSRCFTARAVFPNIASFVGFNSQGCQESTACADSSGSLLGANYTTTVVCCDTDNCNPVTISGASSARLSVVAVLASAVLVSGWSTL
ncbi:hypothetical protein NHX12_023077 [Muraenolepis orangiensis]|uniref:UPAR/Ly6 domain-containing protein n=1 Tax=Muraenolepis orangiensis TaxID=630683 RepID=A0A9Q0ITH3_9TELE|nr:hypothetical protein NHX12_023077 [Muraenolepis orangiensis]